MNRSKGKGKTKGSTASSSQVDVETDAPPNWQLEPDPSHTMLSPGNEDTVSVGEVMPIRPDETAQQYWERFESTWEVDPHGAGVWKRTQSPSSSSQAQSAPVAGNSKRSRGNTKNLGTHSCASGPCCSITQRFNNQVNNYIKEEDSALERLEHLLQQGHLSTRKHFDRHKEQQLRIKHTLHQRALALKLARNKLEKKERNDFQNSMKPHHRSVQNSACRAMETWVRDAQEKTTHRHS